MISFDIFDTLLTRSTATPKGIFVLMQNELQRQQDKYGVSRHLAQNFYHLRVYAERLTRQKLCVGGKSDITLPEIYETMFLHGLADSDTLEKVMELECDMEYRNILPITENIQKVKDYLHKGEKVVLISDMYLSQDFLRKLLLKWDAVFEQIPIYVSSEFAQTKASGKLYELVKEKEAVAFDGWLHIGDNQTSDVGAPAKLGIKTEQVQIKQPLAYEKELLEKYEMNPYVQMMVGISEYLVNKGGRDLNEEIGISYAGPILYTYVEWILNCSLEHGITRLYFVARDGWILKRIADLLIETRSLPIQTEYVYGSRKAWRMASLDEEHFDLDKMIHWAGVQNWNDITNLTYLLQITPEELVNLLPVCYKANLENHYENFAYYKDFIINYLITEEKCKQFLLEKHKEKKETVIEYLRQTIDVSDSHFAFVELSGTGFTQVCLANLLKHITDVPMQTFFIQLDGRWQLENCRFSAFFSNTIPFKYVLEMLCRAPHGQTDGYQFAGDKITPILGSAVDNFCKSEAFERYVNSVMMFCDMAGRVCQDNFVVGDASIMESYLRYNLEVRDSRVQEFFAGMTFSTSGINDAQSYAIPLTKKQLRTKYLYGENPQDYKGGSLAYALEHLSDKQLLQKDKYIKMRNTDYGKWLLKRRYNKKNGLDGSQRYFYPKNVLAGHILLYAAGKVGKDFYKQLSKDKNCDVVAWTDSNYDSMSEKEREKLIPPDRIAEYEFDYILIAVAGRPKSEEIREELMKQGIAKDKILWIPPLRKRK